MSFSRPKEVQLDDQDEGPSSSLVSNGNNIPSELTTSLPPELKMAESCLRTVIRTIHSCLDDDNCEKCFQTVIKEEVPLDDQDVGGSTSLLSIENIILKSEPTEDSPLKLNEVPLDDQDVGGSTSLLSIENIILKSEPTEDSPLRLNEVPLDDQDVGGSTSLLSIENIILKSEPTEDSPLRLNISEADERPVIRTTHHCLEIDNCDTCFQTVIKEELQLDDQDLGIMPSLLNNVVKSESTESCPLKLNVSTTSMEVLNPEEKRCILSKTERNEVETKHSGSVSIYSMVSDCYVSLTRICHPKDSQDSQLVLNEKTVRVKPTKSVIWHTENNGKHQSTYLPDSSSDKYDAYPNKFLEADFVTNALVKEINVNKCSIAKNNIAKPEIYFSKENVSNDLFGSHLNKTLEHSVHYPKRAKRVREKDFCCYCYYMVSSFARHLQRYHSSETDVQEFMSMPPNSNERMKLIALIRKKGNYLLYSNENCVRPVRRDNVKLLRNQYSPCIFCFGIFRNNRILKHRKICSNNPERSRFSASDVLTSVFKYVKVDRKLRNKVFPKMPVSEESLVAKNDILICAYGVHYLKSRKAPHDITACSRKMLNLAGLLIEIRKLQSNIKNLLDVLKPQHYDILVKAIKIVANYDEQNDTYKFPKYTMNIIKQIKDCCEIAMKFVFKKKFVGTTKYHQIYEDLKKTIDLINSNWRSNVSSQAANNFIMVEPNEIATVPLGVDTKLLKEYLTTEGIIASSELRKDNKNVQAYIKLLETVYCKVLLQNRETPGELEKVQLCTYENPEIQSSDNELEESITPPKTLLMSKFNRIVIERKSNCGMSFLFSDDVQEHISLIRNVRHNFFEITNNAYLFGTPYCTTPISGYEVLTKHAKACVAKNPSAITATKWNLVTPPNHDKCAQKKTKRELVPWTKEQKDIVTSFFKDHINNSKAPRKFECEKIIELHKEVLQNKSWLKIKVFVQNQYRQ